MSAEGLRDGVELVPGLQRAEQSPCGPAASLGGSVAAQGGSTRSHLSPKWSGGGCGSTVGERDG